MNLKKVFLITATIAVILTVILAAGCTSTTETQSPVSQKISSALDGYTATNTISDTPLDNKLVTEKAVSDALAELKAYIATHSSGTDFSGLTFDKSDYGKVLKVDSNGKLTLGRDATGSGGSTTYVDAKWGNIKGTLSNQEDLMTELNKRLNLDDYGPEDNGLFLQLSFDPETNGGMKVKASTINVDETFITTEEGDTYVLPSALPTATDEWAGAVKVKTDSPIIVDEDTGEIDVKPATSTTLGAVKAGDGVTISDEGDISVDTTKIQQKLSASNGVTIDTLNNIKLDPTFTATSLRSGLMSFDDKTKLTDLSPISVGYQV